MPEAQDLNAGYWRDPRQDPQPSPRPLVRPLANSPVELIDLVALCRAGRIYAVESWIRAGKPLQAAQNSTLRGHRQKTALEAAIEGKFYDLSLLLLSNGYRPDLEPSSPLSGALASRQWDLVDLLLAWGDDPLRVSAETVLDTYQTPLFERFWGLGVDFTRGHALAHYLADSTSNRPAYGWARRHHEEPRIARELTMALGEAVSSDNEKAVSLLIWAKADPHRGVPHLRWSSESEEDDILGTAIEDAVLLGKGQLLRKLKPDPKLDNFESLWSDVRDSESLDYLASIQPPKDWSPTIVGCIRRMGYSFFGRTDWPARHCIERMAEKYSGRLTTLEASDCTDLRRSMLRLTDNYDFRWLMAWLSKPAHCDPSIYAELARTPAMQARLAEVGLRTTPIGKRITRRPH